MFLSKPFRHVLAPSLDVIRHESSLPFFTPTSTKLLGRHPRHPQGIHIIWNSREHRKQRYRADSPRTGRRRFNKNPWVRVMRMSSFEPWNISWWVSVLFTLGSIIWIVNGFQVFLPFVTSIPVSPVGSGWSAWVGATIFTFGSVFLVLEAWNRDDVISFGYAVEHALEHHRHRRDKEAAGRDVSHSEENTTPSQAARKFNWIWWSTDNKHWHELGFVAAFAQFCGATIFWISGFTGISEIISVLESHTGALDGAFWLPQVLGGTGFIISSTLYMLEAQKKWYTPTFDSIGWHIGFWNFVGAIGFTTSGAFGFSNNHGLKYQSALSTFWGSWAFLIGSLLQFYEAVNPVSKSMLPDVPA